MWRGRADQVAHARRDGHPADAGERGARHRRPRALGGLPRLHPVGLRHEPRELLAAEAGEHVALADAGGQPQRRLPEHPVAGHVAVDVVDVLEVVEVEDGQGELPAVAHGAGGLGQQALLEHPPVHQPRQGVGRGPHRQLGACLGVADRERHEVGESAQAGLGVGRQGLVAVGRHHHRAPQQVADPHGGGDAAAERVRSSTHGTAPAKARKSLARAVRPVRATCTDGSGLVRGTVSSRGGQESGRVAHRPTNVASPSSKRTTAPPVTPWTVAASSATRSNTSWGEAPRATAVAMRRSATCSRAARRRLAAQGGPGARHQVGRRQGQRHVVVGALGAGGQGGRGVAAAHQREHGRPARRGEGPDQGALPMAHVGAGDHEPEGGARRRRQCRRGVAGLEHAVPRPFE